MKLNSVYHNIKSPEEIEALEGHIRTLETMINVPGGHSTVNKGFPIEVYITNYIPDQLITAEIYPSTDAGSAGFLPEKRFDIDCSKISAKIRYTHHEEMHRQENIFDIEMPANKARFRIHAKSIINKDRPVRK